MAVAGSRMPTAGIAMKERDIQRAVLDLLAAEGVFAFRINTAAFSGENAKGKRRFFKAHGLGRGAADILAFPHLQFTDCKLPSPHPLWIELKGPHGQLSPEQKSFADKVRS